MLSCLLSFTCISLLLLLLYFMPLLISADRECVCVPQFISCMWHAIIAACNYHTCWTKPILKQWSSSRAAHTCGSVHEIAKPTLLLETEKSGARVLRDNEVHMQTSCHISAYERGFIALVWLLRLLQNAFGVAVRFSWRSALLPKMSAYLRRYSNRRVSFFLLN